ncbi:unnamed protein product [Parajaminaea phylloscopi]
MVAHHRYAASPPLTSGLPRATQVPVALSRDALPLAVDRDVTEEPLSATLRRLGAKRRTFRQGVSEQLDLNESFFAQQQAQAWAALQLERGEPPDYGPSLSVDKSPPSSHKPSKGRRSIANMGASNHSERRSPDGWGGHIPRRSWFPTHSLGPLKSPLASVLQRDGRHQNPDDQAAGVAGGAQARDQRKKVRFASLLPTFRKPSEQDYGVDVHSFSDTKTSATARGTSVSGADDWHIDVERKTIHHNNGREGIPVQDANEPQAPPSVGGPRVRGEWMRVICLTGLLVFLLATVLGLSCGIADLQRRLSRARMSAALVAPSPSPSAVTVDQNDTATQSTTPTSLSPSTWTSPTGSSTLTSTDASMAPAAQQNGSSTALTVTKVPGTAAIQDQPLGHATTSLLPALPTNHSDVVSEAVAQSQQTQSSGPLVTVTAA